MPLSARVLLAAAFAASTFVLPAHAQYAGPSTIGQTTVADILKNPVDDQDVQLQGHLLKQTASDKYVFSDGTGEIVAEIKAKRLPKEQIDDKTKVELIGEVDTSTRRPPEIEVDTVRVLK